MSALLWRRPGRSFINLLFLLTLSALIHAEGSRSLYPASYPAASVAAGARANLDLQPSQYYVNRIIRRGFVYVYACGSASAGADAAGGADDAHSARRGDPQDAGALAVELEPLGRALQARHGKLLWVVRLQIHDSHY